MANGILVKVEVACWAPAFGRDDMPKPKVNSEESGAAATPALVSLDDAFPPTVIAEESRRLLNSLVRASALHH